MQAPRTTPDRTPRRPGRRRAGTLAAAALGLTSVLSGCDRVADTVGGPDPAPVVEDLAAALSAGDVTTVAWAGDSGEEVQALLDAVVGGLGEVTPVVTAGEVVEDGTDATATLTWSWPLVEPAPAAEGAESGSEEPQPWTYDSEVGLVQRDDAWLVAWEPRLVEPTLGEDEVLDATPVAPARGDLVGAGGQVLVTDRPVTRFGIDRSQFRDAAQALPAARALARLVGVDVASYVARVEAAGEEAFVEAITYRQLEVPTRVGRDYRSITGVLAVADSLPLAPTREFAAPILGTVGPVTAEMVEEDPAVYAPGDEAGLSGLQARYDAQLRGTPGVVVNATPADSGAMVRNRGERELFRLDEVDGTDLRLSLDRDLQSSAERLLADVGPGSAIVALRPSTGAVLAAANGPGSDGLNFATFGQAAPGSTFKIVSSLALLRSGLTPASTVPCTTSVVVDGRRFTNYSDYPAGATGEVPLRTAVANSCNTAFISQRDRLGDTDLADAAATLGLGVDHDLGFPAYFGSIEPPTTETGAAADLIGQGTVLASPLTMASVVGTVAAGELTLPWLLDDVRATPSGDVDPLSAQEAGALRGMLRAVVTEGSGSALADVPGPPVIAKTGTAEFERDGRVLTHAWMVAAQGDLAVAVYVDEGQSGSVTAGPLLEGFLRAAR
ncbi:penicillin-binding transpeptidase domain-containing protein [Nocardioides kribbensis]|uniref:penicillin-binding transpeptidase domain-containing protein n=1 Tax=Nocardioides kribbensis TaxID=305517 RepID=UPI0032DA844C